MVPSVFTLVTFATYVFLLLSLLFTSSIKTQLSFSIFSIILYFSYQIIIILSISMDYYYSPPLSPLTPHVSPLTSPESMPPPSPLPPYYIEEPKTLTEQQLNEYREAAMHIINTHTYEEASKIFLEGLIPVNGVDPRALPKEKKVPETGDKVKNGSVSGTTVDNVKK